MSKSKVLLKVTGSIAAYKAAELLSRLSKEGYEVRVVASQSALRFVGEATFEGLSGNRVYTDIFATGEMMGHIHLMRWADLIIVAPATANYINKCASGLGEDLLSTLFLAHDFDKPYLIAPAMNASMYQHPITKASLKKLSGLGLQILPTGEGSLACGETGSGRLLEAEDLFSRIKEILAPELKSPPNPTTNLRVLVTAGGTQEPVDQVRHLGNASSGATGSQLATAFVHAGYDVTYLHAKGAVQAPQTQRQIEFTSFMSLDDSLKSLLSGEHFDVIVHAAAVSDFSVSHLESEAGEKLVGSGKISSVQGIKIVLKPNHKIIDRLRSYSRNKEIKLVGFKLTSGATLDSAQNAVTKVFESSGASAVVHNDTAEISSEKGTHPFRLHLHGAPLPIDCANVGELATKLSYFINPDLEPVRGMERDPL